MSDHAGYGYVDLADGIAGMDALCQSEAEVQGHPAGVYRALVGTPSMTPLSRVDAEGPPFVREDGVPIIDDPVSLESPNPLILLYHDRGISSGCTFNLQRLVAAPSLAMPCLVHNGRQNSGPAGSSLCSFGKTGFHGPSGSTGGKGVRAGQ